MENASWEIGNSIWNYHSGKIFVKFSGMYYFADNLKSNNNKDFFWLFLQKAASSLNGKVSNGTSKIYFSFRH